MSDLSTLGNLAPAGFAALGFVLGMRHATDPDHVIAVTAILTRERRLSAATRTGLLWGLGHSLTVLLVGCAIIVLKIRVPVRLGLTMELGVGMVLILLGLPAAAAVVRTVGARLWPSDGVSNEAVHVHSHVHGHGDSFHRHPHVHLPHTAAAHSDHTFGHDLGAPAGRSAIKSFGVGLVHGLAGSAAVALLVLGAIPQPLWAVAYLAVFCTGTIAGMSLITTAIGAPMVLAAQRVANLHRGLVLGSGLLSLCFGLFIAYQIGIADGLFSSTPIWIPH
ncbi:MAG: high-affinity nickel-transport family protein [Candidatus Binataceae bacterium]